MEKRDDILASWQALYTDVPPELAEGEKTAGMIAAELGVHPGTARTLIKKWLKEGRLVSVGYRRNGASPFTEAYKVT